MQTRSVMPHSIMIDIDEVLAEHVKAFKPFASEALNVDELELNPTPDWDFFAWFGSSGLDWRDVHDSAISRGMLLTMEPKPDAADTVEELYQHYKIVICTSRTPDPQSVSYTVEWLNIHGICYDDLAFMTDKSALNVTWRIDDSPHHTAAFFEKGQRYVIWDAWYNQEAVGPRVRSWNDIRKNFVPSGKGIRHE